MNDARMWRSSAGAIATPLTISCTRRRKGPGVARRTLPRAQAVTSDVRNRVLRRVVMSEVVGPGCCCFGGVDGPPSG